MALNKGETTEITVYRHSETRSQVLSFFPLSCCVHLGKASCHVMKTFKQPHGDLQNKLLRLPANSHEDAEAIQVSHLRISLRSSLMTAKMIKILTEAS